MFIFDACVLHDTCRGIMLDFVCWFDFLYRDHGEALGALLVKDTYSRIISAEFGVI